VLLLLLRGGKGRSYHYIIEVTKDFRVRKKGAIPYLGGRKRRSSYFSVVER